MAIQESIKVLKKKKVCAALSNGNEATTLPALLAIMSK
jgi:hypothetical protein